MHSCHNHLFLCVSSFLFLIFLSKVLYKKIIIIINSRGVSTYVQLYISTPLIVCVLCTCKRLFAFGCLPVHVCIHACQSAFKCYIQLYTCMHLTECVGVCACVGWCVSVYVCVCVCMCVYVCEYVLLTSEAAADRKHYSNHAYPPLTAKT